MIIHLEILGKINWRGGEFGDHKKMGKIRWRFQANSMKILMRPSYMEVWENYI